MKKIITFILSTLILVIAANIIFAQQPIASTGCISGNCDNGYGKYVFDGGSYEGNFVNGKREGQGILINTNFGVYVGQFANGVPNGKGKFNYSNGNIFEGSWINDVIQGQGIYKFKNGNYYIGNWENAKLNGYGKKYYKSTNTVEEGIWKDNAFVKSATAAEAKLLPLPNDTIQDKQLKAKIALVVALKEFREARSSYESAVAKYNRNVEGSPVMARLMPGTVERATTQLAIMRRAFGNLLRDHGEFLPPDDYKNVKKIYDDLPSTPSGN